MKHRIDPKVDCIFKALLGCEDNHPLLINFLNAFLLSDLGQPSTEVKVLNPYIEQEFIGDKFGIVDVILCAVESDRFFKIRRAEARPTALNFQIF